MPRILITGMSGAGKSTLLAELRRRGHDTVDTDYDGWTLPDGTWDETRVDQLLTVTRDVMISGTVQNQGRFYDRFDAVILLTAPPDVLIDRVARRAGNPYGHTSDDQAEIRRYIAEVEPLLRRRATLEHDGRRAVSELADEVEKLLVR